MSAHLENPFDGATRLIRQHFADFYGNISEDEIERMMYAERLVLADVAERCVCRALLRAWREGVDGPDATSLLAALNAAD